MTFTIVTADQRLREKQGIKGVIFGASGIGKTSLLRTLPEETTLFGDIEAGGLSVQDWRGDAFRPTTWEECRDFAVLIGGANPALRPDQAYSQSHYEYACRQFGDPAFLDKYETYFIDSITVAGRLCFQWCKGQPVAQSDKKGVPDMRAAYGLHGQEMIAWLTQLQHIRNKNVWLVGILDEKVDDFNRKVFVPQIDGSKTGLELPGIMDQVITMRDVQIEGGELYRAFVCQTLNKDKVPAKDRSGRLDMLEPPHLGNLMAKINGARPAITMQHTLPPVTATPPEPVAAAS